jgi:hypothetical protein
VRDNFYIIIFGGLNHHIDFFFKTSWGLVSLGLGLIRSCNIYIYIFFYEARNFFGGPNLF